MLRTAITILATLCTIEVYAYKPLYVVNGTVVDSIEHIPHENIERIDNLPANEETIAEWGLEAAEGVILVTLRYDTEARFSHLNYSNFTDYLATTVRWEETMPAERVSLRIVVESSGKATINEVIDSSSKQFLKRVTKAINEAPLWSPAERNGTPVESLHLVNLQLPKGKQMPREMGVIIR
ncbi:MAG: TonB-dependent receptor [Alistipes sp.]|nr:TonB-dependent receptor [Alistipes sp.]